MSASTSARVDTVASGALDSVSADAPAPITDDFPALPTETDIYILPDGRVIVADLPAELAVLVEKLGEIENR